ncbi:MAG: LPXTG cell wall anchor domain-containing protein, partial [Ruminococcus sp.]|nr:LPXTG cell wall anchor domain-containing protein [Ruminococcus sp.]
TTTTTTKATTTTTAEPTTTTTKATTTTTAEPTTTTTTATITTTAKPSITTTIKIKATAEPTTTTTANHIASDEELCSWSINDYNGKNDIVAVSAEITEKSDSHYQITLTDDSDVVLDVYDINPESGIGTDSNSNEVNLPQTGNNSLANILMVIGASMMTVFGFAAIKFSSVFRRKDNK